MKRELQPKYGIAKKRELLEMLFYVWNTLRLLLLLVFVLPFLNLLPKPTAWLLGLSGILLFCFAFHVACGKIIWKQTIEVWLILILAILFCVAVSKTQPLSSFKSGWTYAVLLCSFFPAFYAFQNEAFRHRIKMVIAASATVVSAYGVFQYFFMDLELKWVDFSLFSDIGARVTSVFSYPNVLGSYLLLCLPFSLAHFMSCKGRWQNTGMAVAVPLQLLCLILTWSRGAWLGALTEVAVFFLFYSRKSRRCLLFFAMLSPLAVPLLPQTVCKRLTSIGMNGDSSIRYRVQTWKGVLRMVKEHPFGIGSGEKAFSAVYPKYAVKGTETVPHAHHLLMQISCELGWLGLFVFVLLCLLLLYRGIACCRLCNAEERNSLLECGCALLGAFVMGMFDHIWYHRGVFFLFWLCVGFCFSVSFLHLSKKQTTKI